MNRIITVKIVTDALAILSSGSPENHLYMFDNNRLGGSYGEGTSQLVTVLDFAERKPEEYGILCYAMNLRPDVAVEIEDIQFGTDAVKAERRVYEGTDISYWMIHVERAFDMVEGTLFLRMANSPTLLQHKLSIRRRG